jgi:4'-phosphopantetheinyl transferase
MTRPLWFSAGIDHVPDDDAWIDDAERHRFGSMRYTKRRDEAMLARWTAKRTVAGAVGLGSDPPELHRVTIRNAPDGAPEVWVDGERPGLEIAMTDRADWAVCAVVNGGSRIGCDLELVEPRSPAFVADYFTARERSLLAASPDADLTANLIWSAKESALKVLRTGLRRDTRTVEVKLETGSAATWNPLVVTASEGDRFPGWWIRYGRFVLTITAADDTGPPSSLAEPPPLATAVPSHRWMDDPIV